MELEPDSVALLESGKFYHVNFAEAPPQESLKSFGDSLRANGVRAVVTLGEISVTDLCFLFSGMNPEDREKIRESLNYVNPVEHEQTK
jgi:hypothetical protein